MAENKRHRMRERHGQPSVVQSSACGSGPEYPAGLDSRDSRKRPHARRYIPVLFGLLSLALSACSTSTSAGGQGGSSSASTIDVGVIADMTGTYSAQGDPDLVRGIDDWVTVVNAHGGLDGHTVKADVCDTASTILGASTCAHQLGNTGDVLAMVVPAEISAANRVLASDGKVVFTQTPLENPAQGSNLYQVVPPLTSYLKIFIAAGVASGRRSLGLIVTDDASGVGITKGIEAVAAGLGVKVVTETIPSDATDATVQVEQLEADRVGMIFDGGVGTAGIGILRSIKQLGLTGMPVGVEAGNVEDEFLTAAEGTIPGQIYGPPNSEFSFPVLLSGQDAKAAAAFEAQFKSVTGHAMDTSTSSLFGALLVDWAAHLLVGAGSNPSLSAAQSYLRSHALSGFAPLRFPATGPQDSAQSLILAEAQNGAQAWTACIPGGPLTCPPAGGGS